jgi:DNA uptake protein ComE-like DNA-binding protein
MQNHWKAYFIFSIKEQRGILVLGLILLLSILIGILVPKPTHSLKALKEQKERGLFNFDPNTIDSTKALLLGIPPKQIHTLLNYRSKGGRFKYAADLAHLYGLKKDLLAKLIPFVVIENSKSNVYANDGNIKRVLRQSIWTIDINEANEMEWKQKTNLATNNIQGILQYKKYLGGFESIHQLSKVYGLTDSCFQLIRPHLIVNRAKGKKMQANTMRFDQWQSLGLFQDKEIWQILRLKKSKGGKVSWRDLVIELDLTQAQALALKQKIVID